VNQNINSSNGPDLSLPLPDSIMALVEKGRHERVQVLPGTERPNKGVGLYAKTHVEISFQDEENLIKCVKLLYWSDQRLSKLPDLIAMWDWQNTVREKMTLYFSTGWYDKEYFEARNMAFQGRNHFSYYQMFGATVDDLKTHHEILNPS
jgi:hypothetical protein